jgi:hypothetical protein
MQFKAVNQKINPNEDGSEMGVTEGKYTSLKTFKSYWVSQHHGTSPSRFGSRQILASHFRAVLKENEVWKQL